MAPCFWMCGRSGARLLESLTLSWVEGRIDWGWREKSNRRRKQMSGGRWSYTMNHVLVVVGVFLIGRRGYEHLQQ